MRDTTYANIVGSVMYTMVCTQPNIAHDISIEIMMWARMYCDSDFATNYDNKKTHTAYIFTLNILEIRFAIFCGPVHYKD